MWHTKIFLFIFILCVTSLRYVGSGVIQNDTRSQNWMIKYDVTAACRLKCNCGQILYDEDRCTIRADGRCDCCSACQRQLGQSCDYNERICDISKKLKCQPKFQGSSQRNTCQVADAASERCRVNGTLYESGEEFLLDCRTRCRCESGDYACVSLCPHELIRPSSQCYRPQLVQISSNCCKEWLCQDNQIRDGVQEDLTEDCVPEVTEWSECSMTCGLGSSWRKSNRNPSCKLMIERRTCQITPCHLNSLHLPAYHTNRRNRKRRHHHHHHCQEIFRNKNPVHLKHDTDPSCISVDKFKPTFCGMCRARHTTTDAHVATTTCHPHRTRTRAIAFKCHSRRPDATSIDIIIVNYMFILSCRCA